MSGYEVPEPILNSPYTEPQAHWYLVEGEPPEARAGRREAGYFYRDPKAGTSEADPDARGEWQALPLVNQIRQRLNEWRALALNGGGGVTRTTHTLLNYWHRAERQHPLFFAQLEAVETILFLTEARADFLQGLDLPTDEPGDDARAKGYSAFRRYACKMATGTGKTTVMGMLAAWSILNKVHQRHDARYAEAVLIVCPNVTIRNRLSELDPLLGAASLYRKRDLVPETLMPDLAQGKVLITNWHVFEPQTPAAGGVTARVIKAGVAVAAREWIRIGPKNTTARNRRYLTLEELHRQVGVGLLNVVQQENDAQGHLVRVLVESTDYIESDTALVNRVLGRDLGGKHNLLVFNDEAHHAYRIRRAEPDEAELDLFGEDEDTDEFIKEATVWIEGLDKINKVAGINFCVDLSATPYFLARVGQDTNKTFPWVVSDFGLNDAIESGLVKIPQLAVRDNSGREIPGYFNVWRWIMEKLTPAERGGRKASPKPEAILKWAHTPIAMLAGLWENLRTEWDAKPDEARPPVFILVCKNTRIANVIFEWLANDVRPDGIPPLGLPGFRNAAGRQNTIVVHSKVTRETDAVAKSKEDQWMRWTLDTVGKLAWPADSQNRPIYPEGFEEVATALERPLHPPGRDVRCIVSVGMLTEGWDCNTVTHIVGLRPFMSQLLCEQVVGRGLRRASYEVGENGKLTEEVAQIFGVPFEVIPFKTNPTGPAPKPPKRQHVHAIAEKAQYEIQFPRVSGYRQAIRNRITIAWDSVAPLILDPLNIPPEVQMKALIPNNHGRPSLMGPGKLVSIDLNPYRAGRRIQELVFELAGDLTRAYAAQPGCIAPAHVLFPQLARVADDYLREKVRAVPPMQLVDAFLSPYYGWMIEQLSDAIRPDVSQGEAPEVPVYEANRGPGSTAEVSLWTSREVREVVHSHLNYVVADTKVWEQAAAYVIDTHPQVAAFVKNAGLGFAIPYLHNGQAHDYIPDFIVRLRTGQHLILETKGYDELADLKAEAAHRWVNAVNADGRYGTWSYAMARKVEDVQAKLTMAVYGALPE